MSAILHSLNVHNLHIFYPILMILVSKFMVHRALSDKRYLSLGLLSPLISTAPTLKTTDHSMNGLWCSDHGQYVSMNGMWCSDHGNYYLINGLWC